MERIGPQDARLYLERWKIAEATERQELRRTSMETKLRQLAALMASARIFGDDDIERRRQNKEVQERWQKIRRAYGV